MREGSICTHTSHLPVVLLHVVVYPGDGSDGPIQLQTSRAACTARVHLVIGSGRGQKARRRRSKDAAQRQRRCCRDHHCWLRLKDARGMTDAISVHLGGYLWQRGKLEDVNLRCITDIRRNVWDIRSMICFASWEVVRESVDELPVSSSEERWDSVERTFDMGRTRKMSV